MNNLAITVSIIAIAIAQALTIVLTIGRERDIRELRKLVNELRERVDEQRLRIIELRAWLAGRNAAQPGQTGSEREPIAKAPEPAITPNASPDTLPPSIPDDELQQATKTFKWFKDDASEPPEIVEARKIIAGLLGGAPPQPETAMKEVPEPIQPRTAEDELRRTTEAIKWLKEDTDKARGIVAGLHGAPPEKIE